MPATPYTNSKARILDCTIRDGNYAVGYQFTLEDTFVIARGLAASGIQRIEVGHGLGLNAGNTGKGYAASSDIDYIKAACEAIGDKALIGSFFIPGIGTEDSMRNAVDAGLGFVRLGIDIDEYQKLEPFTRLAKSLGLEVWGNMMKSYTVAPKEFGEIARRLGETGIDVVALVDSAGGMKPDDVAAYVEAAVGKTKTPLAFHGHNNLTLAVANCLHFVQAGGSYVDGSLSGLGRSGGNAATELLAALLSQNQLLAEPVDWEQLIKFADTVMAFCVPDHSHPRAAEIATGLNFFHSSFSPVVEKAAAENGASLFKTILHLPASSRKKVTPEIADNAAKAANSALPSRPRQSATSHFKTLERVQPVSLHDLAERLSVLGGKSAKRRIVTIAYAPSLKHLRIAPLRTSPTSIVAHIELDTPSAWNDVRTTLGGKCDFLVLDKRLGIDTDPDLPLYHYDDDQVVATAVIDALQMLKIKTVAISGKDKAGYENAFRWVQRVDNGADALIAFSASEPASIADIARVREHGLILLLQTGAILDEALTTARRQNLTIWRLDCGSALTAEAERLLATHERFHSAAGLLQLDEDTCVVAGGVVGRTGDIVVDHCKHPRFILGEADGYGGIRPTRSPEKNDTVQKWILDSWNL